MKLNSFTKQIIIWGLLLSSAFAQTDADTTCRDNDIDGFAYYTLDKTHYGVDSINHDNEFVNEKEDFLTVNNLFTDRSIPFSNTEKKNIITHMLFHPKHSNPISIDEDIRIPLIVLHGIDVDKDINPLVKADNNDLCKSVTKQKHYIMGRNDSYFSVMNGYLSKPYITDKYRVYYYSYPSHKHITFNARMLSNLLYEDKYIQKWLKENKKLNFLAHSMGGLVARSMLEEHNGIWYPEGSEWRNIPTDDFLGGLITLATPHHGSPATSSSWFDTPDIVSKNRKNPASQDMYWDNYDNIYFMKHAHHDIFNLGSRNATLNKDYIDCDKPHASDYDIFGKDVWYSDTEQTRYKFMENFDNNYTRRFNLDSWKSVCYQGLFDTVELEVKTPHHPNPWLTHLNNILKSKDEAYKKKYIFYGGINDTSVFHLESNIVNDEDSLNPLRLYGAEYGVATDFMFNAGYLSDLIVPTTSSIFDISSQASSILNTTEDKIIGNEIESFILESPSQYLLVKDEIAPKIRFFKDYHHSRIHAGSYHNYPHDMYETYKNFNHGINKESVRKEYIKQAYGNNNNFIKNNINDIYQDIKQYKIDYDPLYIRLFSSRQFSDF